MEDPAREVHLKDVDRLLTECDAMAALCQDALDLAVAMTVCCAALRESLMAMADGDIFEETCNMQGCMTFLAERLQTLEVKLATVVADKDCLEQRLCDLVTKNLIKEEKLLGEMQDWELWPCEVKGCECGVCVRELEGESERHQEEIGELKRKLAEMEASRDAW